MEDANTITPATIAETTATESVTPTTTPTAETQPVPAGWYEDPSSPENIRWWNGTAWTENVQPRSAAQNASRPADLAVQGLPAIANWQTSAGFSFLGYLASYFLTMIIGLIAGFITMFACIGMPQQLMANYSEGVTLIVLGIVIGLFIIYPAVFYRSYFTEKPRIVSNKAISFLNFFFGNIIFGALWNSNLTNVRLGVKDSPGNSYIVCIVLYGASCALYLYSGIMLIIYAPFIGY